MISALSNYQIVRLRPQMYQELILKSFVIGLIMALPTGPVGMLSVRRALANGCGAGLASGLASSLADVPYIALARIGATGFSRQLLAQRHWLAGFGFAILFCIGIRLMRRPSSATPQAVAPTEYKRMFASAFLLTVSNPTILLSSAMLFAAAGLPVTPGSLPILTCVLASLVGSIVLWAVLSLALERPRTTMTETGLARVTRFTGLAVIALGAVGLVAS